MYYIVRLCSYYVKSKNTADRIDTKADDSKNKQSVTFRNKKKPLDNSTLKNCLRQQ